MGTGQYLPSAWNAALDNPSAASAVSAMTCAISAASALGPAPCLELPRDIEQVPSGSFRVSVYSGMDQIRHTG